PGGDRHRRHPRDPDRLLCGAHCDATDPYLPAALDGAAAVVELPGTRLRLANDPLWRRRPQLVLAPGAPGLGQPRVLAMEPVDRLLVPLASVRRVAGLCRTGADP